MKTKISPLEELKLEKQRLQDECEIQKVRLLNKYEYAKKNLGTLTLGSTVSTTKSGLSGIFSLFSGKHKNSDNKTNNLTTSGFSQALSSFTPVVWEMAQPILLGFVLEKVKSIFKSKKKKKKK